MRSSVRTSGARRPSSSVALWYSMPVSVVRVVRREHRRDLRERVQQAARVGAAAQVVERALHELARIARHIVHLWKSIVQDLPRRCVELIGLVRRLSCSRRSDRRTRARPRPPRAPRHSATSFCVGACAMQRCELALQQIQRRLARAVCAARNDSEIRRDCGDSAIRGRRSAAPARHGGNRTHRARATRVRRRGSTASHSASAVGIAGAALRRRAAPQRARRLR